MPKTRTPREQLERAMHVSFKLPEQARALLDAYRDQVLAGHAEERAMSSLTGAAALRSASLQAYEGIATHGMPDEVQQQVSAWLSRLASEVEGRARTAAVRTGQEAPVPDEAEAGYVCGVCKDPDCGHCLECTCEACDEARKYAETLASAEEWVLSAAQTRVANLPTNFSGSHIAASRIEVLAAITRTDKEF